MNLRKYKFYICRLHC